jgi:serine/threonine protein kinase
MEPTEDADHGDQVEALFSAVMELPAAERGDWLKRACGTDDGLLAEVSALVDASGADEGLPFSSPSLEADVRPLPPPEQLGQSGPVEIGEKPGDHVGPYKLLQQIGEGGFGIVFLAEQTHPVRRKVAVKIIKPGMDTREVVARFEAERQALAMMDHPNIARVFDAGATASGRPYFVMELVNGDPITVYCDANKLTARDRLSLMIPVCRAVQSAHINGVVHRDLKPNNVLVTMHDGKPVPKVIDFGIAKATGPSLTDRTLFTAFGKFIGTPAYMSPEQAERSGLDVDTRTDVYGLGVLLYELLTGTTPVDARVLRDAAYDEMIRLIREHEPSKPSTKLSTLGGSLAAVATARGSDPKKLGRVVRNELDWIVMKSLEKDRTRRYDTAAALADDLGRYLDGEPVAAGPPGRPYRARKFVRRHRVGIAISAAVIAVLLLGVIGTTVALIKVARERRTAEVEKSAAEAARADADRQRDIAEAERAEAKKQQRTADATVRFLVNDVLLKASPSNLPDPAERNALAHVLIEPAAKIVADRFKDEPLPRAAIQQALGEVLRAIGQADSALPLVQAAYATRSEALGWDNLQTVASLVEVVADLTEIGRIPEAARLASQLREQLKNQHVNEDDPRMLIATDAYISASYGNYIASEIPGTEMVSIAENAWKNDSRILGDEDPRTVRALANYVTALSGNSQYEKAEPLARQAVVESAKAFRDTDPQSIKILSVHGYTLWMTGHAHEAVAIQKRAFETAQRVLGDAHPDTNLMLALYGCELTDDGRVRDAIPLLKRAFEQTRSTLGDDHPKTVLASITYVYALNKDERYDEALPLAKQVWTRFQRSLGEDDLRTVNAKANYANSLWGLYHEREAISLFRQIWLTDRRLLGERDSQTLFRRDIYAGALKDVLDAKAGDAVLAGSMVDPMTGATTTKNEATTRATGRTR